MKIRNVDFVYITSYNECDVPLITGMRDAFARLGKSFAVVGYVSSYVERLHREAGVEFWNLRPAGPLQPLAETEWSAVEARLSTTLRAFIFPEQRYYMTRGPKLVRRASAILDGLARLREQVRIGCMIHKLGAELIRQCAMHEAKKSGIKTIIFGTFPGHFKGRTFLHTEIWSERDDPSPPSPNVADDVPFDDFRQLLVRLRDRREVIHYPLVGMRKWSEAYQFFWSMLKNKEYEFIDDVIRRRIEMQIFRFRNFVANFRATRAIPEDPFYFFPLHVFDDSQITVRNPQYYDQSWILEHLNRVMPNGMKLVVKLHPGLDGAVPLSFLSVISKLDKVVLLQGSVNAHEVIKRSAGVIVINSTVAFEAILHRKPVLVLGNWTFGRLGMTDHLDDPRDLPQKLLALSNRKWDDEAVDRTLYDLYGEMKRCSYNRDPINYDAIVSSILADLGDTP